MVAPGLVSFMCPGGDGSVYPDRVRMVDLLECLHRVRGWDITAGIPSRGKLVEKGLSDVADWLVQTRGSCSAPAGRGDVAEVRCCLDL